MKFHASALMVALMISSAAAAGEKPRHARTELGPARFISYAMIVNQATYEKHKDAFFQGLGERYIQCAEGDLIMATDSPEAVIRNEQGRKLVSSNVDIGGLEATLGKVEGEYKTVRDLMARQLDVIKITSADPANAEWAYAIPCKI